MARIPIPPNLENLDDRQVRAYLEQVRANAEEGTNTFETIFADSGDVTAVGTDTLTITGGNGVSSSAVDDTLTMDVSISGQSNEISVSESASTITIGIEDDAQMPGTGGINIPVGTTAQRPTVPVDGDFRINSTTADTEMYRSSSWRSLEAAGAWTLIASATASGSATVEFTDLSSTYHAYCIIISDLLPADNTVEFWIRLSDDNGDTFKAGASDYEFVVLGAGSGVVGGRDTAQAQIEVLDSTIFGTQGNSAGTDEADVIVYIFDPSSTSHFTKTYHTWMGSNNIHISQGGGMYKATDAIDAIQFLHSAGNIATGDFRLYGITNA